MTQSFALSCLTDGACLGSVAVSVYPGVALGGCQFSTTNGTGLSILAISFCAGGMAQLFGQDCTTDGTGLSVLAIGFCAGGVAQSVLLHIGGVVATGASLVGLPADLGTGGCLSIVAHTVVAEGSSDGLILRVVATGTSSMLAIAVFRTSCTLGFNRNHIMVQLKSQNHTTSGTGLIGSTGCSSTGNMAQSRSNLLSNIVTGTGHCSNTRLQTGGSQYALSIAVCMATAQLAGAGIPCAMSSAHHILAIHRSESVSSICIAQCSGRNSDLRVSSDRRSKLRCLVGNTVGAIGHNNSTATVAANISTSLSRIERTS